MISKLFKKREKVRNNRKFTAKLIFITISGLLTLTLIFFNSTTEAATETISIIRQDCAGYSNCYTSLSSWEQARQRDLVAVDEAETVRIEGTWTNPDTTPVVIDGWTTDATRYIRIYTTPEARHTGKWDNTKYRLDIATYFHGIDIKELYVQIDGLQIQINQSWKAAINIGTGGSGVTKISNNIIKGNYSGGAVSGWGIYGSNWQNITYIWNNIFYNFINPGQTGFVAIWNNDGTAYVYNNTAYNSETCYLSGAWRNRYLKNNIAQNCTDGFSGTFHSDSNYNISNLSGDAPGANSKNSTTVSFLNPASGDFHLSSSDTAAKDAGANLSSDTNLAFSDDIDGNTRSGSWDMGADEENTGGTPPPPPSDVNPPARSAGSPSGMLASGTASAALSLTTNENATCKYSISSGVSYNSMTGIFSTTGGSNHSTSITNLQNGQIYSYNIRCTDQSNNINTDDYPITFSVASALTAGTPTVSRVSGALSEGSAITITGSSFGTNGPNIVMFDNFEGGANGSVVSTGANSATINEWSASNGSGLTTYSNEWSHSGTKSMKNNWDTPIAEPGNQMQLDFSDATEIFYSFWTMVPSGKNVPGDTRPVEEGGGGGTATPNWKMSWIWGGVFNNPNADEYVGTVLLTNSLGTGYTVWFTYNNGQGRVFGGAVGDHMTKGEWSKFDYYQKGGVTDGILHAFQTDATHGVAQKINKNNVYTLEDGYAWNHITIPGYGRGKTTNGVTLYDDVYVSVGPGARARVEIGNASTYAASTNLSIATVSSWSDNSITTTVRQGSFTPGQTAYLYVIDANGNVNASGYPIIMEGVTTDTTAPSTSVSLSGGTYTSAQIVTLTPNEPATTYYTIDGSTPTTASAVYSSAISVPRTTTLKYFSVDTAGNTESVKTQIYTINISTKFSLNDRVKTIATLNVRQTPSSTGTLLGVETMGNLGTVISGPTYASGFWWWQIAYDTGLTGWSVEDWLEIYTAPGNPSISSVSGTFNNGANIILSGSNFGTKSVANPLVWENFEWGNDGDDITGRNGWIESDAATLPNTTIDTARAYGAGSRSSYYMVDPPEGSQSPENQEFGFIKKTFPESDQVYVSYMTRIEQTAGTGARMWKIGRLVNWSAAPSYNQPPYMGVTWFPSEFDAHYDVGSGFNNYANTPGYQSNTWHRIEMWIKLSNPADATNGELEYWLNYAQKNPKNVTITRTPTINGEQIDTFISPHMYVNSVGGKYEIWMDDVYIDNTKSRTEICNSSTWTVRTHCEIQIPTAWSNNSVNFTANQGAFTSGQTAYLYVIDASGKVNASGYPITIGGTTSDLTAPVISSGSPTGTLSYGIVSTTISVSTNENATCKYTTTANQSYASMPNTFSTTGGTSHTATISGLTNGSSYNYYIKCQDVAGNKNTSDYPITFSVASAPTAGTPSVNGVSGALSEGSAITITGSSFGANGPNIVVFDNFEKGTNGSVVSTGANSATVGKWDRVGGGDNSNPPTYSDLYSVSGNMAFKGDATKQTNPGSSDSTSAAFVDNLNSSDVYLSYWVYWPTTSSFPCKDGGICNIKYAWLYDTTTLNDRTMFSSAPSSSSTVSSIYFFGNGSATGEHYFSPSVSMQKGKWYRLSGWIHGASDSSGRENAWIMSPSNQANIAVSQRVDYSGSVLNPGGSFKHFSFNAYDRWCNDCAESAPRFDDVYMATGSNARARVEIGNASTYSASTNLAIATVTSWSDTSVSATLRQGSFSPGQTAYLYVIDSSGNVNASGYPITIGGTTQPSDTTAPVISAISSSVTTTGATISWNTNEAGTSRVEYGLTTSYGNTTPLTTTPSTSHSRTITSLSPNTTYHYRVATTDASTNTGTSQNRTFTTQSVPDTTAPSAITTLSISDIDQTSLTLSWTVPVDASGISSYDIRYNTSPITETNFNTSTQVSSIPIPANQGTTQSQYISVGLTPNTTYYFAIKSKDSLNNISSISNTTQAITLSAPSAESETPSTSSGTISTPSGGGGGGYTIYQLTDTTPPAGVSTSKINATDGQIALSWSNPKDSDFIRVKILRKIGSQPTSHTDGTLIYEGQDQLFTDTDLLNNQTYYYAIYAYDKSSNLSTPTMLSAVPLASVTQTSITTQTTPTFTIPANTLPPLTGPFSIGMENNQVKLLQQYLSNDKEIYPERMISGYYGTLTQRAVERFQKKYNIISSGSPYTTGYGLAGPGTRSKIMAVYGSSITASSGGAITSSSEDALKAELQAQIAQLQAILQQLLEQLVQALMLQLQGMAQ